MVSKWIGILSLVALLVLGTLAAGFSALGQEEPRGRFSVSLQSDDKSLAGRVVLVSLIRGGQVVNQDESKIGGWLALGGTVGVYDVRVEGEGIVTDVKRGVHIFEKDTALTFKLKAGKGAHVVEYATGGLAREEVAAKLAKLEAEMAEVKKKIGQ